MAMGKMKVAKKKMMRGGMVKPKTTKMRGGGMAKKGFAAGGRTKGGAKGGVKGGNIIAEGKPEEIIKIKGSYTGEFLKPMLNEKFKK